MCISIIRSKTDAIETLAESEAGSVHDSLKLLLGLFSQVERALEAIDDEDEGAFRRREDLIDLEAHILTKAAALKAPLIRDALYKLALWRWWSASELDPNLGDLSPADAVVYSAFRDLIEILGERELLTEKDLANGRS